MECNGLSVPERWCLYHKPNVYNILFTTLLLLTCPWYSNDNFVILPVHDVWDDWVWWRTSHIASTGTGDCRSLQPHRVVHRRGSPGWRVRPGRRGTRAGRRCRFPGRRSHQPRIPARWENDGLEDRDTGGRTQLSPKQVSMTASNLKAHKRVIFEWYITPQNNKVLNFLPANNVLAIKNCSAYLVLW